LFLPSALPALPMHLPLERHGWMYTHTHTGPHTCMFASILYHIISCYIISHLSNLGKIFALSFWSVAKQSLGMLNPDLSKLHNTRGYVTDCFSVATKGLWNATQKWVCCAVSQATLDYRNGFCLLGTVSSALPLPDNGVWNHFSNGISLRL
jgi:hypothetical protein